MSTQREPASTRSDAADGPPAAQHAATVVGACVNPICLRGFYQRIAADTGEVLQLLGSPELPSGVIWIRCKDRRASRCPSCARLYERDAYQLLAAGLRGGKGIPASVGTHPAVMVTLTAPSFGPIHGNRDNKQACNCGRRHDPNDPQIGTPVDRDSYRYVEQIVWNRYAPELWKRTAQTIRRHLAQALGVPRSKLAQTAQVRFAKAAEFQRRGVVHYHAIIRLDGPGDPGTPAPSRCTANVLARVVETAAAAARVALPQTLASELGPSPSNRLRWGSQREVLALDPHTCTTAAGYIAKYATKATENATGPTLLKPIRSSRSLDHLPVREHPTMLVSTAWRIGERTGDDAFKRWAHQFAYGGHTLTKSRDYSITFAALRAARTTQVASGKGDVIVRAQLAYAGRGQPKPRGHR